jgi:hypothetical protein
VGDFSQSRTGQGARRIRNGAATGVSRYAAIS